MDLIKETAERIKSGNVVFKAEDITVLNHFYDNTLKLALIFNEGKYKDRPVAYFLSENKISDKVETFPEQAHLCYVDKDFVVEGNLKDTLFLAKENSKNKSRKYKAEKNLLDFLTEFPILPTIADKAKFSKSELLTIERHYNLYVKDQNKKAAFEIEI